MEKLVIATMNQNKLKEFKVLMADLDVDILSLKDFPDIEDIEETGDTFYENAYIKAKTVFEKTGYACIADDSGLEVDALGGAPGVYSARYAGLNKDDQANNEKLLLEMKDLPQDKRGAQFHCTIVAIDQSGKAYQADGIVRGRIIQQPIGHNGFGYDPLFYVEDYKKTMAELEMEEKNRISHRGKATREIVRILRECVFQ